MRCLKSPCGSYLSVSAFQSCGRLFRKNVITLREFRFCDGLHFEQSVWMASGSNSVIVSQRIHTISNEWQGNNKSIKGNWAKNGATFIKDHKRCAAGGCGEMARNASITMGNFAVPPHTRPNKNCACEPHINSTRKTIRINYFGFSARLANPQSVFTSPFSQPNWKIQQITSPPPLTHTHTHTHYRQPRQWYRVGNGAQRSSIAHTHMHMHTYRSNSTRSRVYLLTSKSETIDDQLYVATALWLRSIPIDYINELSY